MSASVPELQPDVEETLQVEGSYDAPVVKVCVEGPVRTQALPRKAASVVRKALAANGPGLPWSVVQILRSNPRRAKVTLMANCDIAVAFAEGPAQQVATMATWLVGRALEIEADSDIWIAADGAAGTVSAVVEYWATGQDGGE